MSTGASARPTPARRSSTRRRSCAGSRQLRWKRMKPSGSTARKKSRSSGASAAPAQPKTIARGWLIALGADRDAVDIAPLQRAAQPLGRGGVADRRGLDAVVDAARAEIDAWPDRRHIAEQVA